MNLASKILVTGANGMVGSALVRLLRKSGYSDVSTLDKGDIDLVDYNATVAFFSEHRPEYVFHLAARVGGIKANSEKPAEFIYENLSIQTNVIHSAHLVGVNKLIFVACSCIYPKLASQPLKADCLFSGAPEPTNEAFAYAKIAGIKMCSAYNKQYNTHFVCLIPPNVYGEQDSYSPTDSHVISALIQKVDYAKRHQKKKITLWGTGTPLRELVYVEDLASALVFCMKSYCANDIINIGTGVEISIKDLAQKIMRIMRYEGEIEFDLSKPDGIMRKVLDSSVLADMGWTPVFTLDDGLARTIRWFEDNFDISLDEKKDI